MLLNLKRFERSMDGTATIGNLFVDGVRESFVLEDRVREVPGKPVSSWKIPGATAIPTGRYRIVIDRSPLFSLRAFQRFGSPLDIMTPHLLGVEGYQGIRIHPGTTVRDTEGCLCPGQVHAPGAALVQNSRLAMTALLAKLEPALGLERVPPPNAKVADFLRHWAWKYTQVKVADEVWITITNEFDDVDFFAPGGTSQK